MTFPANQRACIGLTIAGYDPSSGAGITADLAVFAAHGIVGTSAITALTVQSTLGVQRVQTVAAELLRETLACLQADLPPQGIKIGVLADADTVRVVAEYLRTVTPRPIVVLDPVLRASSGADLLTGPGVQAMLMHLLHVVDVVTPNTVELAALTGLACNTDAEIEAAARKLAGRFPKLSVVVTGGHRTVPSDMLLHAGNATVFPGERIETAATHGTGCAFSSALLCGLLRGQTMPDAVAAAKSYVATAMRTAVKVGNGRGPLNLTGR